MSLQTLCDKMIAVNTLSSTVVQGLRQKSWIPKYTNVPARIEPASANIREFFHRDGLQISHIVYMIDPSGGPFSLAIAQTDQLVFAGRVFQIQGPINPDEQNRYLKIACLEKET